MRGRILLGLALLLSLAMALAGCGGVDETAWSGTGIHGYVTAGRGDYAVAGVEVKLYQCEYEGSDTYRPSSLTEIKTINTSSSGYYRFAGLQPGTYLVQVEATAERAGARYQYLKLAEEGQQIRADLITLETFMGDTGTGLPWITSVTANGKPLEPDEKLSGDNILLNVTAESADPSVLPITRIILKIGHPSNTPEGDDEPQEEITGLSCTFDSTKLRDGKTFIYATAYDKNDNAASVKIPVTIVNGSAGVPPPRPKVVRVEAWTCAEPRGIRSMAAGTALSDLPPLRVMVDGKPVYLPRTSSLNAGVRAIGGGSVMVHIQIKPDDWATSYRIYRRFGTSGSYRLIGERVNDEAYYEDAYTDGVKWRALWFNDMDPALQVKQDYYYRVTAVNAAGETDFGREFRVIILPEFTVNLQSPPNGESISLAANPRPVFTWTADGGYGTTNSMGFLIYVLNKDDEDPSLDTVPYSWVHMVHGAKSARYGEIYESGLYSDDYDLGLPGVPARPLVPHSQYEWDLILAYSVSMYAGMDYGESYAVSYSFPRIGWSSSNGAFTFDTTP